MLQVARLARKQLGESADLVARFLLAQRNDDGGFRDRAGASDLYYTVFGLEGLIALCIDPPAEETAAYLRSFGDGESLDFVHLACLARCWADVSRGLSHVPVDAISRRIETHRSPDGGYNGTLYGCFLALGAYQDLRREMPERARLLDCIRRLQAADGGYANQPGATVGQTPATAAAATLLRQLDQPAPPALGQWLLERCRPAGGFFASPQAPIPDLLSTATALHALAGLHVALDGIREPCLDFIDSLWTNQGAFYGNWADDSLDCEYTYYALLALGHLTV